MKYSQCCQGDCLNGVSSRIMCRLYYSHTMSQFFKMVFYKKWISTFTKYINFYAFSCSLDLPVTLNLLLFWSQNWVLIDTFWLCQDFNTAISPSHIALNSTIETTKKELDKRMVMLSFLFLLVRSLIKKQTEFRKKGCWQIVRKTSGHCTSSHSW